ncbi:hypothetical protein IW140_005051 [Coemansia sp. RSA 1813]|nr:hypothetical protein EV178_002216 [Coemansia sp. RSA 1646]KAJ1765046.1 hypothetical protein LPJ74_006497 [Coemansia sp. RSA 1843]KAJ2090284.1 hypothetical protein IW138_002709 [Coemansia sp. RSA 986]KAJ2215474.1 hypothetical protein EV179_002066 [Coemansia sp. RSA 487]KAJ2566069.1 hypothetical protein IW140_005051 [Coemansia sp. RSA 1813]
MNSLTRRLTIRGGGQWTTKTIRRLSSGWTKRGYSTQNEGDTYLESAKKQLREYHNWRRHFVWPQGMVRQILRDYSLWSALALLAYYNLSKRQEREEYDAETFVFMDNLQERIYGHDPDNRLLKGTIWEHKKQEEEELLKTLEESNKRGNSDGRKRGTAVMF